MRSRAYKLDDWCGLGPRIIVHPKGLPPSWTETNITAEEEAMAMEQGRYSRVVHLDPVTFEVIATFELME
jgi:hypothetical protein